MDPSIMKLLEEDEDESMHSGADVEAFQAALNRDIGGDATAPQPTDAELIHASIHQPPQTNDHKTNDADTVAQVSELPNEGSQEFNSSIDLQKNSIESSCHTSEMEEHEIEDSSVSGLDKTGCSPNDLQKVPLKAEHSGSIKNHNKQIPFVLLLPALKPHLDKNSEIQLQNLFTKLRKNEIPKTQFVKLMRNIVGDKVLRLALSQMQVQQGSNQPYAQSTMMGRPPLRPPVSSSGFTETTQSVHIHPALPGSDSSEPGKQFTQTTTSAFPYKDDPSKPLQYPQGSYSIYGNNSGSYQIYPGTSVSASPPSIKPVPHQTAILPQSSVVSSSKVVRQSSLNNPNAIHGSMPPYNSGKPLVLPNSIPYAAPLPSVTYVKEESIDQSSIVHSSQSYSPDLGQIQLTMVKDEHSDRSSSKVSFSTVPHVVPANSGRTPPKKPAVPQKKPLDSLGSPPQSGKKQKVSGGFLDQSIEQLNDVTAVSGVNLSEEEEQLLSAPKEDSRISEASRKVVQEEEERLILERNPLRKKLTDIMMKFGLKSTAADVEKCLSLCVEERLHGLLCNLIRLSKQRVDVEKTRHRTLITSDVRQQLMSMNRKAKEEWEKKQAEADKLRKVNENDNDDKPDGEKDDGRQKPKANKEEDDKMRTNAANVAARAAVGVDDMLSKWQLIAQARQKHEVSSDKEVNRKTPKNPKDPNKRTLSGSRRSAKNQPNLTQNKVVRAVSVKDVISALERESQMCKSTLIYRLYEKVAPNAGLLPNNN